MQQLATTIAQITPIERFPCPQDRPHMHLPYPKKSSDRTAKAAQGPILKPLDPDTLNSEPLSQALEA